MTLRNSLSFFLLVFFGSFLFSCGEPAAKTETETTEPEPTTEVATPSYKLTPFTASTAYPDAKIESMTYKAGKFAFGVSGENYKLGEQTPDAPQKMCANSGKGQHIHLIVDNAPYSAQYTANFEYDIADGDHYLLAFLSRSYHESIKTTDASTVKKINVKDKSITSEEDITEPMLFYSRPKGSYVGKANTDKIMVDFYLHNVRLGADYKVKIEANDQEVATVDTWQPYYLEGLPIGQNKVRLTLVDAAGQRVETLLNPIERVFTLSADPADGM